MYEVACFLLNMASFLLQKYTAFLRLGHFVNVMEGKLKTETFHIKGRKFNLKYSIYTQAFKKVAIY